MKNEPASIQEQIRNIVPRKSLSPAATERFEESYRMLGIQKEPERKHKKSRRAWIASVASIAACFALLFGTNAAFPAFAESLPVVGKVFQSINDSFRTKNSLSKQPVATYVGTYEVQDVSAAAAVSESNGYRLSAEQAFSDGQLVTFSMKLETPQDTLDRCEFIFYPDISATVNGEPAEITSGIGFYPENDVFTGTLTLTLPQPAEDRAPLDVAVSMPVVKGKNKTTKDDFIPLDASFSLSFQATVDASNNRAFILESEEDNGLKILGVEATPATTKITVRKPYSAQYPALYLEDGTQIASSPQVIDELRYDPDTEEAQGTPFLFDGVPAGTDTVVFRFYRDETYTDVLAEFTIDLTAGTAVPSKTYEEGGALDIDSPFNYSYIMWEDEDYYANNKLPEFINGYAIPRIEHSVSSTTPELGFVVMTEEPYRELKAEAYGSDGTLIGSTVSCSGTHYENRNWFWDESSPFYTEQYAYYPYYSYALYINPENGYRPAWKETITVKLSDNQTGEEILTKEFTLSGRIIY